MTRSVRATVAATVIALGSIGAPAVLAADQGVDIAGFAFSPQTVTISVGDSVTWSNADAQSHTATADDGSFDTGTITSSTPKAVAFTTAGTFPYHCRIHPAMTATLVVQAVTAPATDAAPGGEAQGRPPTAWLVLAIAALGGVLIAARRFSSVSPRG